MTTDPNIGRVLDNRYLLERVLGEGGMGVVYKGQHQIIGKNIAVKILREKMARDAVVMGRFLQEAKAASAIGNPHIVDVSDFGTIPEGSHYFVMEYIAGKSLGELLAETKPLPVRRAVHIGKQIAAGLGAAHSAGIVHRDLKPDNVMLVDRGAEKDFVKILDFGIAKVGHETARVTKAGDVFGTPHYMSPEQAAGTPLDLRTDIYSLGVILYEMTSGRVPFDAENFMGILTQHMYKAPVPVRALVPSPDIPAGLDAIILKCLSKRSEQRYASMEELEGDLGAVEKGEIPRAVHELMGRSGGFNVPADYFRASLADAVPGPAALPKKRWTLVAGSLAAVAVAITAGILVLGTKPAVAPASAQPPQATVLPAAAPDTSAASPVAPAPVPTAIVVSVDPSDAHVFQDGKDLGSGDVPLLLPAKDATASLEVRKEGFGSQSITVDTTKSKWSVKLVSLKPAKALVAPPGKGNAAGSKRSTGTGEFGDPWR